MTILLIILGLLFYLRYRPSFYINDDGDVLVFYWKYFNPIYLGYDPEDGFKERKVIKLFNLVS